MSGLSAPATYSFTRGAIRHYFFAGEMLGPILVSIHNIRFYQRFMADLRSAIEQGRFITFATTDPRCLLAGGTGESDDAQNSRSISAL